MAADGNGGVLPKWLGETVAELAPSNLGDPDSFHNAIDNPESRRFGANWWWCDGTFGGPTFLAWIDSQHTGFVHELSKVARSLGDTDRAWPGSNTVFRNITGKTFDELWKGYVDAYAFKERRPISDCMDPQE